MGMVESMQHFIQRAGPKIQTYRAENRDATVIRIEFDGSVGEGEITRLEELTGQNRAMEILQSTLRVAMDRFCENYLRKKNLYPTQTPNFDPEGLKARFGGNRPLLV